MRCGFSFCGTDIEDIGLEYAPENKDTYVYKPTQSNVHEETFDGHHGGYFYGATKQPKEFILRCFYQDSFVAGGVMAKAYNLFRVGKSGKLVFHQRPWCYYYATVTSVDTADMYSYLNGMFVVTMKAYYPFARCDSMDFEALPPGAKDNSAFLGDPDIIPETSFDSAPASPILLYNPGTERSHVGIVMAGQAGDGVTLRNLTTGQSCRYVAFDTASGKEIYTDGINGKTVLRTAAIPSESTISFLYHDFGFIELEPAFPIVRDLHVTYDGTEVTSEETLYQNEDEAEWYIGKYIYLDSAWRKITACEDDHTLTIQDTLEESEDTETTNVVLMNEIQIVPSNNTSLSKISFVYKPTFA